MPRLEQHRQHLTPELHGTDPPEELDLALIRFSFVLRVPLLEGGTVEIVEIGDITGREERPLCIRPHTLHEEVGDPMRRVHVVRPAPVVTSVLPQLEELLQIEVPGLEIGADSALPFPALVYRDSRVIRDLEEGDDALTLSVRATD